MRRILTALTLIFAIGLTGCTGETAEPTVTTQATATPTSTAAQTSFTLAYYPDASLHPITGNNRTNLVLASLVYQGLFELDNTFTPTGVLCAAFSVSEDALTWTFTLADAVFSDGSALTADDVVASLELARTSDLYADRLSDIQSITASGDNVVTITLSSPNGALPALLDIPIVRESGDDSLPLGTGPYAFEQDADGSLRLVRQSSAPETAPEEIALYPVAAADDLIYAFDAGEISLVVSDLTGTNALGYAAGYEVFSYPTTTMLYVGFQTTGGPCEDALVRQALSQSFDRDTVTVSLLAGYGEPTCLPFSPVSDLYSSEHEQAGAYNSASAQLLTEAGYTAGEDGLLYKDGTALSLTFLVNTDNSFKLAIAEYLAGQLTGLGISVELQKLTWDDYVSALEAGNFDLYLGEVTLTADFDLSVLLSQNGALNYGGYASSETEILLQQLCAADTSERPQAAAALLDQFQADMPLAPLCFKNNSVLTRWQAVSGMEPTRQNPFYHLELLSFGTQ